MTSISCENIKVSFGVDTILENVTFSLNDGDRLGIVGVNGAGKTTLFRAITGEYSREEGNVYISKDKTIGVLGQMLHFNEDNELLPEMLELFPELLKQENELEHLRVLADEGDSVASERYATLHERFTENGGYEFRGRCRGLLISLGFTEQFWNVKISALSGGQKTRLALAGLLLKNPDIMLLDEPTNHLDLDALFWLEDYLRQCRATVLVISHDRYFLDRVTNKTLEIENKRGKLYNGNYSFYVEQKKADREAQQKHYDQQQREIARIEGIIEQQRRWGQEHNFITIKSKQKQLEHMEKIDKPEKLPEQIKFGFSQSGESGSDVIELIKLSKSYPSKPLFSNINLMVKKRDHVFISGSNGCGKSTLMKIIAGTEKQDSGYVNYGYNVKIGYYDQENQQLDPNNTVIDELWNCYGRLTQTEIRKALAVFLFKGEDVTKKVSVLSGGEKARLTLAKLIISPINLLILDEPTNHLDINSREALENALLQFDGTIIAVSHDRYFINKLANRIFAFNVPENGMIYDYHGTFEEYLSYKKNYLTQDITVDSTKKSSSKQDFLDSKKTAAEQRKIKNRLKQLAEIIESAEAELDRISAEINGEAATDYVRLAELYDREEQLENQLLEWYGEQEELSNK